MSDLVNDATGEPADSTESGAATGRTLPAFDPAWLERRLSLDAAARWGMIIGVALVVVLVQFLEAGLAIAALLGVVAFMFAIASGVSVSLRTLRDLALITGLLANPKGQANAESVLAVTVKRWPLPQWLRVVLVHRWAVLRYRQNQYAETAAIAGALLQVMPRIGQHSVKRLQSHTTLMLLEAQLQMQDLTGAYHCLLGLDTLALTQAERLQRLVLQTRYELMCDRPECVAQGLARKVELAELMPATPSAGMHAMLAQACTAMGRDDQAAWLRERAALLASDEQVNRLLGNGGVVVGPPEDELTG